MGNGNESSNVVDRNKLTQRELLILLTCEFERLNGSLNKLSKDYVDLHVRVSNIETRNKTMYVIWGVVTVAISLIINLVKLFV